MRTLKTTSAASRRSTAGVEEIHAACIRTPMQSSPASVSSVGPAPAGRAEARAAQAKPCDSG